MQTFDPNPKHNHDEVKCEFPLLQYNKQLNQEQASIWCLNLNMIPIIERL